MGVVITEGKYWSCKKNVNWSGDLPCCLLYRLSEDAFYVAGGGVTHHSRTIWILVAEIVNFHLWSFWPFLTTLWEDQSCLSKVIEGVSLWLLIECRFLYAFFGVGIITLFITCIGNIAAETSHDFCLACVSSEAFFLPCCIYETFPSSHVFRFKSLDLRFKVPWRVCCTVFNSGPWCTMIDLNFSAVHVSTSCLTSIGSWTCWLSLLRQALAWGKWLHYSINLHSLSYADMYLHSALDIVIV